MKYANMSFSARNLQNLGDNIQLIAIDNIYKNYFNLSEKEIIYIDKNNLKTYDGPKVILPISLAMVDYTENGWAGRFSEKITPVFLGLSISKDFLSEHEVSFFKKYEPIGCRDERTYRTFQRYSILSYLSGCITLTFPKRISKQYSKIYVVDVDADTIKNLPAFLQENLEITTHFTTDLSINPKIKMQEQYDMYKDNAKCVITSLLHCSLPCIAAGIPVICVKSVLSYRFAWIDKLLKIYNPNELSLIHNIPSAINIDYPRSLLLNLSVKRLKDPTSFFPEMNELTNYWLDRNKKDYVVEHFFPFIKFIQNNILDTKRAYTYSIWGVTQISEMLVEYLSINFPNVKLKHVYDRYNKFNFYGVPTISSEFVSNDSDFIFITALGPEQDVKEKIKQGIIEERKVCFSAIYR